jgi:hypothetical protein
MCQACCEIKREQGGRNKSPIIRSVVAASLVKGATSRLYANRFDSV